jgi:hypothetical protein
MTGGTQKLAARAAALGLAVALSVIALVVLVPDGNDYALATRDKHRRLESAPGRRIVFIGGSNLAFGLDSAMIEGACRAPVVNMGMNGWLGVRFIMNEVEPDLRRGDTLVLSFEYDNYVKSAEGTPSDLLMILKARPASFHYLTAHQTGAALKAIPFGAQQKTFRLVRSLAGRIREFAGPVAQAASAPSPEPTDGRRPPYNHGLINRVERYSGFNRYGDLTSHLDLPWPYEREDGLDLTATPIEPAVIEAIRGFTERARQRGVRPVILHTSLIESFHRRHTAGLARIDAALRGAMPEIPMSPPERYVFPERLFFDTVYHLTREGRELRTRRVIEDLSRYAGLGCGL